jgi:protein-tyrosine-phosphatase
VKVTVGVFEGCPNAQPTVELLHRVLSDEGQTASVEVIHIDDPDAAVTHRFLGSPTVQIDGMDIEPARRDDNGFAVTCRVYQSEAGNHGIPPVEMVRAAVREATANDRAIVKTVLFVCGHNAGRSQMAEAYLNHVARQGHLPGLATSAGTGPAERINPAAVQAMAEIGIPMEGQYPKVMTQEMVDAAAKAITMGCGVDVAACPARFLVTEDWDLDDPAGQPIDAVRTVRDEIRRRVDALLKEMTR